MLPIKGVVYETVSGYHHQAAQANQRRPPCADFELNAAECLEAYGVKKGFDVCYKYLEDFRECLGKHLTDNRVVYMKYIRAKKVASGEIPWEKRLTEPVPFDSYISGAFYP